MSDETRLEDEDLMLADAPAEEARPDDRIDDERMDEENTLKPEFVRAVEDALEEGDEQAVYDLVEPLHPADIADLLELLQRDERRALAAAITDLMSGEQRRSRGHDESRVFLYLGGAEPAAGEPYGCSSDNQRGNRPEHQRGAFCHPSRPS